jgi:hypothetical protein
VGTNDAAGASPHRWGVLDMDLDGRASQQTATGSARDLCSAVQVYGYGYTLGGLTIRNGLGAGLRCEWGQYGDFPMQAAIGDINIDTCNRHGVWFNGPHDTLADTIVIVDAGQEADNTYCGVYVGPNGPAQWSRFHAWHRSTATRRMRANFSSPGASQVSNSQFEGGRILYEMRAGAGLDILSASRFYASFGTAGAGMVDALGNSLAIGGGCIFHNSTSADVFAIRIGRAGATVSGISVDPATLFYNFATRGPFDLAGDVGLNRLGGIGYGNAVPGPVHAQSRMDYVSGGPDTSQTWHGYAPGPFAGDTDAKAAGVRYGGQYLAAGGGVAWVST